MIRRINLPSGRTPIEATLRVASVLGVRLPSCGGGCPRLIPFGAGHTPESALPGPTRLTDSRTAARVPLYRCTAASEPHGGRIAFDG